MSSEGASYRDAGVDYETLDEGKRQAMAAALSTSPLLAAAGGRALDDSRGEPAFAFELAGRTYAFVVEGLGTKSVVARQVAEALGIERFADVAYDTVAAIVNDLCCVGALPLVVNAYFATGSSAWYGERARARALVEGWRRGCADAGATWGGGESPSLSGLVDAREIELAGAAVGVVPQGRRAILGEDLAPGDEIVLVDSSGLHANGASLARLLAGRLEQGYATRLPDGTTFGEALLGPSVIYVGLMRELLARELELTYVSHITGHGLLKLMRLPKQLRYRIWSLPDVPAVLEFMTREAGLDSAEAYSTFNMGAGYAIYCAPGVGAEVVAVASERGLRAHVAGAVERGPREVLLEPVGVRFESAELELSARGPAIGEDRAEDPAANDSAA